MKCLKVADKIRSRRLYACVSRATIKVAATGIRPVSLALGFCLLFSQFTLGAVSSIPTNLVVEGIPPIPDTLKSNVAPYLALGGANFRGWHTVRREILLTSRRGDVTQLHVMTEPLGKRTPLTRFTEPVNYGWFQPRIGNILVFQSDKGGNEQYQFYALDTSVTNRVIRLLTDGKSRNTSPRWSPSGQWFAYASTRRNNKDNDIFIVNPSISKTTRCVATNSSPAWSVSDWSSDDAKLLLHHGISDSQTELWTLDIKTGARKLLTKKGEKVYFTHPRFGDGDTAVYAMTDAHSDFLTLTRLDLKTGKRECLTADIPWDVEDFEISPDGKLIAFTTNEDGFSRLHLLDLAKRRELRVPRIPGDLITGLAWHESRRELGFTLNGSQIPNDAYSFDLDKGIITRWTNRPGKTALRQKYSEPQIQKIKSFDGLVISSLVYRPDPTKFPAPRPVIVIIHGGPSSQSRPGFRGSANYYLNELGVALVYPNVRGSLGYGRKFLTLDNGFKREDSVKDIGSVLEWIRRDRSFDSKRIAVMGGSYGGFMTLASMVRFNSIIRCGVDNVGVANIATFLRDTSDYRRANRRTEYGDERKSDMRAFLDRISPANNADKIRAPLLIVQGKNDPRVPVTEAERMRDAIRKNGGAVWYLMATDEGHGFSKKRNSDFQFHATVLFLQEHLLK